MQYPHGTPIAVTDGRTLRLFRNAGTELQMVLEELPRPQVHGHEESAARHAHTGQDNKDQQRLHDRRIDKVNQEESFCAAAADWLNHAALSGQIHTLYVVAPPKALGLLRQHYHGTLKERLIGELTKEHTHDDVAHLREALARA
jgi:protein required for attachment to host cells